MRCVTAMRIEANGEKERAAVSGKAFLFTRLMDTL